MNKLGIALIAAVAASALAVPAAAHHPTDIGITPYCVDKTVNVDVGYASFGDGHTMLVTTKVGDKSHTYTSEPLEGSGTLQVAYDLDGYTGSVSVTAQAQQPDGDPEGQPVTATQDYDCPKPPKYRPAGSFIGPCEDPMYAARFDNRLSDRAVTFRWKRVDGGVAKVVERTVPAGRKIRTAFRHVDGGSIMRIRARGEVIASKRSAPGGNYKVCPR